MRLKLLAEIVSASFNRHEPTLTPKPVLFIAPRRIRKTMFINNNWPVTWPKPKATRFSLDVYNWDGLGVFIGRNGKVFGELQ